MNRKVKPAKQIKPARKQQKTVEIRCAYCRDLLPRSEAFRRGTDLICPDCAK